MGILDFKKRFGQTIDIAEVKKNFVNEINYGVIQDLDSLIGDYYFDKNGLFDHICLALNLNPQTVVSNWNRNDFSSSLSIPSLRQLTRDDFENTLVVIEAAYEFCTITQDITFRRWPPKIDFAVKQFLNQILSLNIFWYEGKFYPEGAEELDEKLIKENLTWLNSYPKVKKIFSNALDNFSQSLKADIKRKDAISNSFQAVEELTKMYLENDKSFDNNYNELIQNIGLAKQWGNIINFYKELSKEFGRHSGRQEDFIPSAEDTEAFLYLSGLLLRLILNKINQKNA